jgi:hypothetical protein
MNHIAASPSPAQDEKSLARMAVFAVLVKPPLA